jgi:hypothetical protein
VSSVPPTDADLPAYVVGQQRFYEQSSRTARIGYLISETVSIAAAAGVPVVVAAGWAHWITALLGAVAATATGLRQAFNYRENWILRAAALEAIKASIARYRVADARVSEAKLVREVGSVSVAETARWQQLIGQVQADTTQDEPTKPGGRPTSR